MEKNRTLKLVEKVDVEKFHHDNRLLLDEVDAILNEIREFFEENEEESKQWN